MQNWIEIRRKPITIGNSRGFVIPKSKLPLKSSKVYVIKILCEDDDHGMSGSEFGRTQAVGRIKTSTEDERVSLYKGNTPSHSFNGYGKTQNSQC